MKKWQSASVIVAAVLVAVSALCPPLTLRAQPRLTEAQAAALQPTPPSLVPRSGTFWSVSRPTAPYPTDPFPDLPAYRLPDGTWLVDDSSILLPPPGPINYPAAARSFLGQASLANQQRLASPMQNEVSDPGLPDPTNSPPQWSPDPPQLLAPGSYPTNGTFWLLAETNSPPFPFDPCGAGYDVYALSDGTYLVDDTGYSWPQPSGGDGGGGAQWGPFSYTNGDLYLQITGVTNSMANLILHGTTSGTTYTILSRPSFSPNDPWDAEQPLIGADAQDWTPTQIPTFGRPVLFFRALVGSATPQRLWLYSLGISNNCFNLVLHGTVEGMTYSIRSTTVLQATNNWVTETNFLGASGQFWTTVSIPLSGRPSLFLSAYSWVDNDGNGMPDWWEQFYFGTNGLDPYSLCPSGDGWTILQAYQNGWNPTNFYTPPTPVVSVIPLPSDNGVIISWQPAPGAVTGYTILRNGVVLANVPPNQFSFEDDSVVYPGDSDSYIPAYQVRANYALGNSPLSAAQQPINQAYALSTAIVRGPQGQFFLLASPIPNGVATVRVFQEAQGVLYPLEVFNSYSYSEPEDFFTPSVSGDYFDVPVTSFVQGQYAIPDAALPPYGLYAPVCRPLGTNGTIGPLSTPSLPPLVGTSAYIPFLDGSEQLKQNLVFALEAADKNSPFKFRLPDNTYPPLPAWIFPSSYAYANYHFPLDFGSSDYKYSFVDEFKPFEDNYFLRNFVYSPTNVNSDGSLSSGVYYDPNASPPIVIPDQPLFSFPEYAYVIQGCQCSIQPLLSATDSQWIYSPYQAGHPGWANIGITNVSTNLTLRVSQSNIFGLLYQSAERLYSDGVALHTDTLSSGGTIPEVTAHTEYFYAQAAPPQLDTVGYFFGVPNRDYLPGHAGFNPTNTVPAMVAAVGQVFSVAAWAKLTVNGNSNKLAFLEQYFDKAYLADTSGNITTNQTGILSEYGEFFPTEPGLAILTTKTNTSGQRGQIGVPVVGLFTDANHDGVIEPSFLGPDYASLERPFRFWINNDYDRYVLDSDGANYYDDSVLTGDCPFTPGKTTQDCNYRDGAGNRVIPCERDLQDFARLWVCGVTSNLLTALPPGSTVTLSWGDVGNPNSANPTIDLFKAADADGGIGYLTNSLTASLQTVSLTSPYIGRLGPGSNLVLNATTFANNWAGNYFIWCGVSNGAGGLTLTITQGGANVVAQNTMYIQLVDKKQMYERWTIGERHSVAPLTNALPAEEDGLQPFQYGASTDPNTPYILYVHGWNMQTWEKDCFAEAAFKRLYWQGYQGRFGVFRWPTDNGFSSELGITGSNPLTDPHNYDNSEFTAWKSATGLLNKLNDLNTQYPGHVYMLAHSMGNVVAGEALRLAGANQLVNTYVASQGAIPAHMYDSTVTNLIDFTHVNSSLPSAFHLLSYGPTTPNIYGDRLSGNGAAVGKRVNFYNANDYALSPDAWCFDQELKPDTFLYGYYYYSGSTNDSSPWNNFAFVPTGEGPLALDIVNNLQDRYETFAYAAEPRSRALGSTPGVANISLNVDLTRSSPTRIWPTDSSGRDYRDHFWHSAEFRGDYWQQQGYWNELLGSDAFGLK